MAAGTWPAWEEMLMIRPQRCARMCGTANRDIREVPRRLAAAQVDGDHEVESLDRHVLDVLTVQARRGAGAVDQDVEPAPPGGGALDHALGVLGVRDVAELRQRGAARGGDLLDQRVDAAPGLVGDADDLLAPVEQAGGLLVGDDDRDPGGGEGQGDGPAHPVTLAAAGDERYASGQCPASDPWPPE